MAIDSKTKINAILKTIIPISLCATTTKMAKTTEAAPLYPAQDTKSFCPLVDFKGLIKR